MPSTEAAAVIPTAPEESDERYQRRDRLFRRAFFVLLVAFLVGAMAGVFGVRTGEVSATGNGYELTVSYGASSRPGLATPWSVEVRRLDGEPFDAPIVIAASGEYFDLFDENGFDPQPDRVTSDGDRIEWEFSPPDGDTFAVSYDARIEPGMQSGKPGWVALLDGDGAEIVRAEFRTRIWP